VHEGKLVVWIDGYGVLVEPLDESLAALRRQSSLAGSGELTTRAEREDAIPALDGALFVLPAPPGAPALGGPLGLGSLLLALALCFAFGSFFAIRALRRESAAMTARAEFLTSVTHELRTPLAGIRLLAEMLDEGRVPEDKRAEYHRMIASETLRLSSLIENVLDLGRIERGERAYDLRVHDLGAIVREVSELFELVAARDRITLQVASNATEAQVDRGACVQALLNVLDNARKYAAAGQRIEITQEGNEVVVRDFGPGVPAGERERIFARFQRGTAQQDGSVPGLGLGLHLARAIMVAHGGTLACEAPRDGGPGAAFVFRFAEAR
jgi:signal transduction histidine kinase